MHGAVEEEEVVAAGGDVLVVVVDVGQSDCCCWSFVDCPSFVVVDALVLVLVDMLHRY